MLRQAHSGLTRARPELERAHRRFCVHLGVHEAADVRLPPLVSLRSVESLGLYPYWGQILFLSIVLGGIRYPRKTRIAYASESSALNSSVPKEPFGRPGASIFLGNEFKLLIRAGKAFAQSIFVRR